MPQATTQIERHRFSDAERARLNAVLACLTYDQKTDTFQPFVKAAQSAFLGAVCTETIDAIRRGVAGGGVVVEGGPFDPDVKQGLLEGEGPRQGKTSSISEALLIGAVSTVGEPYSVFQEGTALVNNLCPSQKHLAQLTGLGSREQLGLHIENAAARTLAGDRAPDGLALTGVSNEPGGGPPTMVADGRLALRLCDASVERVLRSPSFLIEVPVRWHTEGQVEPFPTAVLQGPTDNPSFVAAFYGGILRATTAAADNALKRFADCLEAVAAPLYVEPGLTVLINNHFMFHGRGGFEASFDSQGRPHRWVQRVFWTSSLDRMGEWVRTKDRIVRPVVRTLVRSAD